MVKVGGKWGGGLLFMVFYLVIGARYQLRHCPVSCSGCNVHPFYFTLFFLYLTCFIFLCTY